MQFQKNVTLKDGRACVVRAATAADGPAVLENFNLTHGETDFLLTCPEENRFDAAAESQYLQKMADSEREIEIVAEVDGKIVGTAGVESLGNKLKLRHRAEFGVSVARAFWGLGVGRSLLEACVECARRAGYTQLELTAVAENERALSMYRRAGFVEFGRNPRGFRKSDGGYQTLVSMRMEL